MKLVLISDTHEKHSEHTYLKNTEIYRKINYLQPKVDAVLHCGDWIMVDRHNNLNDAMENMRNCIDDDIPIFTTFGNHDFWQGYSKKESTTIDKIENLFQKCCKDNGIIRVTPEGHFLKGVWIRGFDGWYGVINPPTNDKKWMETTINDTSAHDFLMKKAYNDVEKLITYAADDPCIIMTHFPPFVEKNDDIGIKFSANLKYFDILMENTNCKALCVGHSHRQYIGSYTKENSKSNTLILNSGGDYSNPKYYIFYV